MLTTGPLNQCSTEPEKIRMLELNMASSSSDPVPKIQKCHNPALSLDIIAMKGLELCEINAGVHLLLREKCSRFTEQPDEKRPSVVDKVICPFRP